MTPSDDELSAMFTTPRGGNPFLEMIENAQEEQFKDSFTSAVLHCMEQEEVTLETAMQIVTDYSLQGGDPSPRRRTLLVESAGEMRHYFRHLQALVEINASGNTEPKIGLHKMTDEEVEQYFKDHPDAGECQHRHA